MLVRIRTGKIRLIIPMPLFLAEQTLEAAGELVRLAERLLPTLFVRIKNNPKMAGFRHVSPGRLIELSGQFFEEMRRCGRWRMVEIEAGKQHDLRIYVDFY